MTPTARARAWTIAAALASVLLLDACTGSAGTPGTASTTRSSAASTARAPEPTITPTGAAQTTSSAPMSGSTPKPQPSRTGASASASGTGAGRTSTAAGPAGRTPSTAGPSTSPSTAGPSPSNPKPTGRTGAAHATIVLNPGHNGDDAKHPEIINKQIYAGYGRHKACETTGTSTNAGYAEHAFNWDVARRVRMLLEARGVTVILTRPDDHGVGPCADRRAFIGNAKNVTATVSIHADGAASNGHGFHICEDSHAPGGAAVKRESHALTVAVHDALERGSGLTLSTYLGHDGYFPRDDLTGLNLATGPATFLELGNMRNAHDAALQSSPAGRQRMADATAAGILAWLTER